MVSQERFEKGGLELIENNRIFLHKKVSVVRCTIKLCPCQTKIVFFYKDDPETQGRGFSGVDILSLEMSCLH